MKAAFFEISEEKEHYFSQNLPGIDLTFFKTPLDEESIPPQTDFEVVSTFVGSSVTAKVINSFPKLKHIAVRATGFDNIDAIYAKDKVIPVYNAPSYGSHPVAEFTFGLILSLARHIPQATYRLKVSSQFSFEGFRGFDLNEKTLGVIGTGKIGANVIKIAKGFNMKVVGFDVRQSQELTNSLGFSYLPLQELLKTADIVTIHVPYSQETHHLINKDNIFLIRKGALLVNTSRGAVVETDALFQAITQDHLGGAALDVLESEGELKEEAELLSNGKLNAEKAKSVLENHILIDLPNVIITPHMAFYTKEAEESIMETTTNNIKGVLAGTPQNIVNP